MDFLSHHGAVIDLRSESTTLSSERAPPPHTTPGNPVLNVIEKHVTIPPLSSIIISVGTEEPAYLEGLIEGDQQLLLNRQSCVARGIAELRDGKAKVVLANFRHEYRHLNIGTTVAYIHEVVDASNDFALFDVTEPASTDRRTQPDFDVNPSLPEHKQDKLKALLLQFKDCFSSPSTIRPTPIAKRRILTEESVRPIRQSPYRVSTQEREAVKKQVDEMLRDDIP